jgi:hypothetical protein
MRNFICWHSLQNVSKAIEKHDSAKSTINNGIGINSALLLTCNMSTKTLDDEVK